MFARWKGQALSFHRENSARFKEFLSDARRRTQGDLVRDSAPNIAQNLILNQERYNLSDKHVDWLSATLFGAGSETTAATLSVFILAMVLHPEVQERAQAEIDAIVGRGRLPSVTDELPYLTCIVKETLRWRPVGPLGVPRRCIEDNWYNCHLIPAGSIVLANVWAMNRDPDLYPDFDEFRPERFMTPEVVIEEKTHGQGHVTFGFGRRVCSGMHLANQTLLVKISFILWALTIRNASGANPSKDDFVEQGLVVKPAAFDCTFIERSVDLALSRELIKQCAAGIKD